MSSFRALLLAGIALVPFSGSAAGIGGSCGGVGSLCQPIAAVSHSIAFTALANGTVGGAAIAGSGTYAGTVPSSISSATWGGGCSGSSTPAGFTAGGGTWSATFTVPASSGSGCTIAITDNLSDSATSSGVTINAGGGYAGGPGDIASYDVWFGLRAYSSAVAAAGTQKAVSVRRQSDNVTCDILIATSGDLGLTSATCNGSTQGGITPTAFAGTDTTGTGSISGTALTFTGGHIGDTVTGGTTASGTFIVSGSSPNWNVNKSQVVTSATLTLTWGLYVATWYDQSGNGKDATQGTTGIQPVLLVAGGPSSAKPQIVLGSSLLGSPSYTFLTGVDTNPIAMTINMVMRTTGTSGAMVGRDDYSITRVYDMLLSSNKAALIAYAAGGQGIYPSLTTINDGTWRGISGAYGASTGKIWVNGADDTGTPGPATTGNLNSNTNSTYYGSVQGNYSVDFFSGSLVEYGKVGSVLSSGNEAALSAQQRAYWGY